MTKRYIILFCSIIISITYNAFAQRIKTGSEQMHKLLPLIQNKRVGLVINPSSVVGQNHTNLVDTLLSLNINIAAIFSPEHGFRGSHDAGSKFTDSTLYDHIPIYSLYGKTYKPTPKMLNDIDVLVYDIQDVGVRFFTYISTLHYVIEAAAENHKPIIICDRPNPNDFVAGPLLEKNCRSFIGLDPIPIVYGLTVGELALMINNEGWLRNKVKADIIVIKCLGWKHGQEYELPVRPSPNLPSYNCVKDYPSLCLFEPTIMSVGRGTIEPFTKIGYPNMNFGNYVFTPQPIEGASTNPKYKGKACYGKDYKDSLSGLFTFKPIIAMNELAHKLGYKLINDKRTFELLCGNKRIYHYIQKGYSDERIKASYKVSLNKYKTLRKKYLLYVDYN